MSSLRLAGVTGVVLAVMAAVLPGADAARSLVMEVGDADLRAAIDAAPEYATLLCDPRRVVTLSTAIEIRKPVTVRGLRAQLPPKLGKTSLLVIAAKGVTLTDLTLIGNGDSVPQADRAPLLVVAAGDFRIENARFHNSSKDGINVDGDAAGEDIVGGVIRDVVGRNVIRDTISISGGDSKGFKVRNILVENVRAYDSQRRGAVEVSDGSENITVRKVYAERCIYAVDVQDHSKPAQVNRHILVEDVYAVDSKHALRTSNRPLGHTDLTVRDITAERCSDPIVVSNTRRATLQNVRVLGHTGSAAPVVARNCLGLILRDVVVETAAHGGPAVLVENCDGAVVDAVSVSGQGKPAAAVSYRLTQAGDFSGVRISNVSASSASDAVVLEAAGATRATLRDYTVHGNLGGVRDEIRGSGAAIQRVAPERK